MEAVNNHVMCAKINVMPCLWYMQDLKLLMLRWCSFSGFCREHVAVVFAFKGCQYLINGCLEPIRTEITQDTMLTIVDTPLTLILRLGRWPCCWLFPLYNMQMHRLWSEVTKLLVNYHTYKTPNCWHSIDAYCNVLSIELLLPSIIAFIMVWTDWFSFCQNITWACGQADHTNMLALFTVRQLKMIYVAKRSIAPTLHLFINQYSQGTAHYSPIIYL